MAKPIIGPIITLAIEDINADLNENTLNNNLYFARDFQIQGIKEHRKINLQKAQKNDPATDNKMFQ